MQTEPNTQDNEAAADPFAGQGGSYELDPATGVRKLIHRTTEPGQDTPAEQAPASQSTEE